MTDRDRLIEKGKAVADWLRAAKAPSEFPRAQDEVVRALQDCEQKIHDYARELGTTRAALQDCERELGREKEWGRKQADFGIQCAERCDAAEQRVKELGAALETIAGGKYNDTAENFAATSLAASPPLLEEQE